MRKSAEWKFRVVDVRSDPPSVVSQHRVGWRAAQRCRRERSNWIRFNRKVPKALDTGMERDHDALGPFRVIEIATGRVPSDFYALVKKKVLPLRDRV